MIIDWNGRCETPVGEVGQVRPRRSVSDEEAQRPPHGKRATWSGNQSHCPKKQKKSDLSIC